MAGLGPGYFVVLSLRQIFKTINIVDVDQFPWVKPRKDVFLPSVCHFKRPQRVQTCDGK